jgi:hypothetical protein
MFAMFSRMFRSHAPVRPANHASAVSLQYGEDYAPEQLFQMWKRIYTDHHIAWWLATHNLVPNEQSTQRSQVALCPGSSTDVYLGNLSAPEIDVSLRSQSRKRGASWLAW